MRHTTNILISQDLKFLAVRLGEYILKYGEADASSYFASLSWVFEDSKIEIKKAVLDSSDEAGFISTMQSQFKTKLEDIETFTSSGRGLDIRQFFTSLHRSTVTINNPGDSSSLLTLLMVPLYDKEACEEANQIIEAVSKIQANYTIVLVGLTASLGHIVSPERFRHITSQEEEEKHTVQKEMLQKFAALKTQNRCLDQIVILQNTNRAGFALNLNQDSLMRILGELTLLCVEKYNTIFRQADSFDREHVLTALGLSVMNLDKYYFEDYLLRKSYLNIMEREKVSETEVDLNKVEDVANKRLEKYQNLFSDFYQQSITPLYRNNSAVNIVAQTNDPLNRKLEEVKEDLTGYIKDDNYSLPEKQAILAMILGYDDALLKGNLFSDNQLTLDNLDEETANYFIEANNACVKEVRSNIPSGKPIIKYGPLGALCADKSGHVILPIKELQQLRNKIRQSTNYIREKSKELEQIDVMIQDAKDSEKRLTEDGFYFEGKVYRFDIEHEEVKFEDTYEPKDVIEKSVDLRENFTEVKDQGEIGACTVFSIASIYEYILKKNSKEDHDLSESFVYYNVRHESGQELEDAGSSYQDVIKSIGTLGICTENLHPYSHAISDKPSQEAYEDAKKRRITKALNVNVKEQDIKSAVQEGYPVAISLKIFNSFKTTKGFVLRPTEEEIASADYGFHAMVVVGYTDASKHFVVRNSWGKKFGDEGYCYIPYSYVCDPDLNRMACIVKDIDYAGGSSISMEGNIGTKQTVQFDMTDAVIKAFVIKNLLDEEQLILNERQKRDAILRTDYETLMQTLGKQSKRTDILNSYRTELSSRKIKLIEDRDRINNVERPKALERYDSGVFTVKTVLTGFIVLLPIIWGLIGADNLSSWIENSWSWILFIIFVLLVLVLLMYWSYAKSQRRKLEREYTEKSAILSSQIQSITMLENELHLKMHVAGMVVDKLLSLKARLNKIYQAMKGYVGNLALWYKEEQKNFDKMDPLVKDPFIPLLSNEQLNLYFNEKKGEITKDMHLYDYFDGFSLDDAGIIAFKRSIKNRIVVHIQNLLTGFTVFRHIFSLKDYPYLDKTYASAGNLLPKLDSKSAPFSLIKRTIETAQEAHFLFIHTEPDQNQAWNDTFPQYFSVRPNSENIESVYKIIELSIQKLTPEEVVLE